MTDIFQTILNMSITGAFIAATIILLRLPLRRLPRKYSYALWSILGIRLLCPISFSSALNLFNLFKPRVIENEMTYIAADASAVQTVVNIVSPVQEEAAGIALNQPQTLPDRTEALMFAASAVWLAGVAVILIYIIISYIMVRRRVSQSTTLQGNVCICDRIDTPFVFGILKPRIYLPPTASGADIDCILAHERVHIRRSDHIMKLIGLAAAALHWFNPMAWISFRLFEKDMECSCDEAALRSFDGDVRKEYAAALLNISAKQNKLTCGGLLSFGESSIKSRIKSVLAAKKPAVTVSVIAVAAIIIAAACLLTNALESKDGTELFREVATGEYTSADIERAGIQRSFTFGQTAELMDRIRTLEAEPFDSSAFSESDGGYTRIIILHKPSGGYNTLSLQAVRDAAGKDILYIRAFSGSEDYCYKITEESWWQISGLIDNCFDSPTEGDSFEIIPENDVIAEDDISNVVTSIQFPASQAERTEYNKEIFDIEPFFANLSLPNGWTVSLPSNGEQTYCPLLWSPLNIYDESGKMVGTIAFNTFTPYEEEIDRAEYYKTVYSAIRLSSAVIWDDYTPLAASPDMSFEAAVCTVTAKTAYDEYALGGQLANAAETTYKGILAYDKNLSVYVAVQLDDDAADDITARKIAQSITLHRESAAVQPEPASDNDFEVKIYSEKNSYSPDEDISVYATVEYIGNENEITVTGGMPCLTFSVKGEKLFNNGQGSGMTATVSVPYTFRRGEPVRYNFQKSGGWDANDPNADFYTEFYSRTDLKYPADSYTVTAVFSCMLDESEPVSSSVTKSASTAVTVTES